METNPCELIPRFGGRVALSILPCAERRTVCEGRIETTNLKSFCAMLVSIRRQWWVASVAYLNLPPTRATDNRALEADPCKLTFYHHCEEWRLILSGVAPWRHAVEARATKQSHTLFWRLLRAEMHCPRNDENHSCFFPKPASRARSIASTRSAACNLLRMLET